MDPDNTNVQDVQQPPYYIPCPEPGHQNDLHEQQQQQQPYPLQVYGRIYGVFNIK